jgi:RimJ/RimL family protein N-acetyltransferase
MTNSDFLVRPFVEEDIDSIIQYWSDQEPEDFERMGVDSSLIGPLEEYRKLLMNRVGGDPTTAKGYYLVWEYQGKAIGFSFLGDIILGKSGNIHLHLWQKGLRGRGLGGILFCLSVVEFYRIFSLTSMFCEPRSENPMPNRMLQKIGFRMIKTYRGKSSPLTLESNLNRFEIGLKVARAYLLQSFRT